MQKIKTLYIRDADNPKRVTETVDPDCQWVIDGEGRATEKIDGTAVLVKDGKLWKRHTWKEGKACPDDWHHWSELDPVTLPSGATQRFHIPGPGWVRVTKADKWHNEACRSLNLSLGIHEGTHELIGPKVQGNLYGMAAHFLRKHGATDIPAAPKREYHAIEHYLRARNEGVSEEPWLWSQGPLEGIVWHHPDGRMAKIKARDFGIPWPRKG